MFTFLFLTQQLTEESGLEELITALVASAKAGEWGTLVGVALLLLVWIFTKMPVLKDVFKGATRLWISASSAVLAGVAVAYFTTGSWLAAVTTALTTGALGGLFKLFTRLLKKQPIEDKDGDGKLDSLPPEADS